MHFPLTSREEMYLDSKQCYRAAKEEIARRSLANPTETRRVHLESSDEGESIACGGPLDMKLSLTERSLGANAATADAESVGGKAMTQACGDQAFEKGTGDCGGRSSRAALKAHLSFIAGTTMTDGGRGEDADGGGRDGGVVRGAWRVESGIGAASRGLHEDVAAVRKVQRALPCVPIPSEGDDSIPSKV